MDVTGAAPNHQGAVINVLNGSAINYGANITASSVGALVVNTGIQLTGATNSTSAQNRGIVIDLAGPAWKSIGVAVRSSADATTTAYGGAFDLSSSVPTTSHGVVGRSASSNSGGNSMGVWGDVTGTAKFNTGASGSAGNPSDPHLMNTGYFGMYGQSTHEEAVRNIGTAGYVDRGSALFPGIAGWAGVGGVARPREEGNVTAGVLGFVGNGNPLLNQGNFAVYGESQDTVTMWAGYFQGNVNTNGSLYLNEVFHASDENLKENIEDLSSEAAGSVIGQLDPVTYSFTQQAIGQMGFSEGEHAGLIAQQVQQVVPHLVREKIQPARIDTLGNVVFPESTILTVNYVGLVPYLIADNKRMQERLEAIEDQLAACCAAGSGQRSSPLPAPNGSLFETDLRIIPNPVADQTELRYTVGTAGHVRLEITDGMGRVVLAQDEGVRTAAAYVYQWNTTMLAAGTYHCTLFVDGEPLVKKAVKLSAR